MILPSCLVTRFVGWNFADIRDHKKFQNRTIENGGTPFRFEEHNTDRKILYNEDGNRYFEDVLEENKTVAFLAIRNDTIIYERYFRGYGHSSEVPSFSMAKSFVGTMIGIAADEGLIESLEDPVSKYLPELKDSLFDVLSIQQVMDQRSGLAFDERYLNPFSDVAKYYYGRKLEKYIEDIEFEKDPGGKFDYNSLNTQLLGLILERTTGMKPAKYLEEKIWKPLGMEHEASWSIDSKKWDTEKAFCCINAVARDYAKFGRLILHKGQWKGKQVVPEEFMSNLYEQLENGTRYHNQFWYHSYASKPALYAQGFLGQYIYVIPEENIVLVRLGKKYGEKYWPVVFQVLAGKV